MIPISPDCDLAHWLLKPLSPRPLIVLVLSVVNAAAATTAARAREGIESR